MAAAPLPTIPLADVASHNSDKSCYVTIGKNVYDVTDFLSDHPGGPEFILDYAGKDVSEIMDDTFSHQHSEAAYDILQENLIGYVATAAIQEAIVGQDVPADTILPLPASEAGLRALSSKTSTSVAMADLTATIPPKSVFQTTGMSGPEDLTRETDATEDFKTHQFLDLRKPLLMQVWQSGYSKDFYLEQVHRPRYYKGGASAPLFGNFLEPLSLTPWWVVPLIWLPVISWVTFMANRGLSSPYETTAYWLFGIAFWTLVEYTLHRGLFHIDGYLPDNRVGITLHFLLHGIHHYLPMDKYRLVMPPTLFVVLAMPFYKIAEGIIFWNWYGAMAAYAGGVFGYVCYDLTHYFLHHKQLPSYYRQLKKYHLQHHYADYENGFGVTSRFWDRVFGTELADSPPQKAAKAA